MLGKVGYPVSNLHKSEIVLRTPTLQVIARFISMKHDTKFKSELSTDQNTMRVESLLF